MANEDVKAAFDKFLNNPNNQTLADALVDFSCAGIGCRDCAYALYKESGAYRIEGEGSHCSLADALHGSLKCFFEQADDGWLGINKSGRLFIALTGEEMGEMEQEEALRAVAAKLTVSQIAEVHQALCAVSPRGDNE